MWQSYPKKALNFVYFHRRRILVATTFMGAYTYVCKQAVHNQNEIFRMGIAGSVAHVTVEAMFHFVDTVNVQAKLGEQNLSSISMVRKIYQAEGLYGFSRGFSAMFYGSVICGFIYFSGYKFLKNYFKDTFEGSPNFAMLFFLASFIAEFFTLLVYYPYDLVKCRLQSKNYHFKYRNIPHAFRKEISQGSILSLYRGSLPFLVTHCLFVSF